MNIFNIAAPVNAIKIETVKIKGVKRICSPGKTITDSTDKVLPLLEEKYLGQS